MFPHHRGNHRDSYEEKQKQQKQQTKEKHMTEANELDVKFDDIDLGYPRLTKGVYELLITGAERVTSEANDYIKVNLQTTTDVTTTDGKTHPAGFKTNCAIFLKPVGTQTMDDVNRSLAGLIRGAGFTGMMKNEFLANVGVLQGKTAPCRVSVYRSKKDDQEANGFNFFQKK
jgi:hypothetical protein